jgi:hypothetical protein
LPSNHVWKIGDERSPDAKAIPMGSLTMLTTITTALLTSLLTTAGALLLARQRMRREFQLQFNAEAVIRKLLLHERWALRSFDQIKHHLGGFDDNELRRLLVQAGALRFGVGGREMWGLFERTSHALDHPQGYKALLHKQDVQSLESGGSDAV